MKQKPATNFMQTETCNNMTRVLRFLYRTYNSKHIKNEINIENIS
jgi:hypothetical protein